MSTQLHRYCNLSNAAKAKLYLSMGQQSTFEESGAENLHAGICAGAWGKPHAYCDCGDVCTSDFAYLHSLVDILTSLDSKKPVDFNVAKGVAL
jgi:hypothetical protein